MNILYTELDCMPTKFIKKLISTPASASLGLWLWHQAGDQELVSSIPASAQSQLGEFDQSLLRPRRNLQAISFSQS